MLKKTPLILAIEKDWPVVQDQSEIGVCLILFLMSAASIMTVVTKEILLIAVKHLSQPAVKTLVNALKGNVSIKEEKPSRDGNKALGRVYLLI